MSQDENFYAAPESSLGPDPAEPGFDTAPASQEYATFGGALNGVFDKFTQLFVPLLGVAIIWGVLEGGADFALELGIQDMVQTGDVSGPMVVGGLMTLGVLCLLPLLWGYCYQKAHNMHHGAPSGDEFDVALSSYFPLVGLYILMTVMMGAGFVMCIIPGVIIAVMLFTGDVITVVENRGPIDAIKRCFDLFDGVEDWFYAFGVILVCSLAAGVVGLFVGCFVGIGTASLEPGAATAMMSALMTGALNIFILPWMIALSYVLYLGLNARKQGPEGFDRQTAAAEARPVYRERPSDDAGSDDLFGAADGYTGADAPDGDEPKGPEDFTPPPPDDDDDVKW